MRIGGLTGYCRRWRRRLAVAGARGRRQPSPAHAPDEELIKYNGNSRDYWEHPPADWFMGDETAQQHGTRALSGPADADAA